MSLLGGGDLEALEASLRFRLTRQSALAGNVVNADTPGYRRMDVAFDGLLEDAALRLERTDPGHLGAGGGAEAGASAYRRELGPHGTRPDGNGVDLQHELVELSRNAGTFSKQATVLARMLALRRVAVTGENR
jgi:flagellar basal-body rod protein FlgB